MKEQTSPDLPHSKLWCEKKKKSKTAFFNQLLLGFLLFPAEDNESLHKALQQEHTALATQRGHKAQSRGLGAAVHGCSLQGVDWERQVGGVQWGISGRSPEGA